MSEIDSILVVSFGGPETPADIMAFLRNVTAGRNVPDERLVKVAGQYEAIGGRSPINDQVRALIDALTTELGLRQIDLPIYWGNRNWDPYLADTMKQMSADGRKHAVAFVTSAYSSYSSCRQYRDDIAGAQSKVGGDAPIVNKIGQFYDHPGFIEPFVRNISMELTKFDTDDVALVFTAHSIPETMAAHCRYEAQLLNASSTIANAFDNRFSWTLAYQSRSGSPQIPWLEPDINDHLRSLHERGITNVIVVPVGFISDHVEVLYDLDVQARSTAVELGMHMERATTPGVDAQFVAMVADLIVQEINGINTNRCLGDACCLGH